MNCRNCNLLLGPGPVRTCPRCFTTTESTAFASTAPPPDSDPKIEIEEPSWHPLVRRIMEDDDA